MKYMYQNEIKNLKRIAITSIKECLGDSTPSRDELREYSEIQREKYNFSEDFYKEVECEIPFTLEVGVLV